MTILASFLVLMLLFGWRVWREWEEGKQAKAASAIVANAKAVSVHPEGPRGINLQGPPPGIPFALFI